MASVAPLYVPPMADLPDIDSRVLSLLRPGQQYARTCKDIGRIVGVSERAVRGSVERLTKERGVLVGSSTEAPAGVFLLSSQAEYERYRAQLLSRVGELRSRLSALERAWSERTEPSNLLEMMA